MPLDVRAALDHRAAALGSRCCTAQAPRPRKIFISVDMEGITGVVQPAQLGPEGFEYQRAREWMTGEVNAAIAGIRAAGPAEIVVCDSHGNGQSVLIDKLPDDVRIVRGFPRPMEMMQGIDESFAAAVFIGYHASEWTANAVRGHTISSARLLGVKLNGAEVSEGMYNAALAGQFGVPVAFVSGDRLAVTQLQQVAPAAEGAIVKEPYGLSLGADGDAGARSGDDPRRPDARDGQAGIAAAVPPDRADRARSRLQADDRRGARGVRARADALRRAQREGHVSRHDRDHQAAAGADQPRAAVTSDGDQRPS